MINEEGLRDWFGKSKSKDGKSGWVNVVTGGTCASDKPGEGTPKCVSSAKRASMSKKERLSAQRRKKAADPGQQSKSGAAKPTYVKTDSPRKMKEETFNEAEDKKSKGSGKKDACYSKVKSRYSVWPSAYASGALVKCRKVGAKNWGNKSKKEGVNENQCLCEACQKGYMTHPTRKTKIMFGKRYRNCIKKESYDLWTEDGSFGYTMTGLIEAEYGGRKVKLGKPMQGDVKKFKVYVKNDKGNVVKVNFGHGGSSAKGKTMRIRKSNPDARKSFRARHNCDSPGPRHKARYWSCKKW